MADVQVVTLLGGQEIIGQVEVLAETYWVKKPRAVIMQQKPGGQMGLGLAPFPPLADQDEVNKNGIHVNRSLVVTANKPIDELAKAIIKQFLELSYLNNRELLFRSNLVLYICCVCRR